jgi:PAS domain S-box-containing protein
MPQPNPLTDKVLRQTVTIAADAIICIDEKQRITFFNDGATQIFGYQPDEVHGKPLEMLLPKRFQALHHRHVEEFGNSPVAARLMGQRRAISGVRKDGSEFPAEAAIAQVSTSEGMAFSVVLRDITDRRRIEDENAQLVRDLQGAVTARDEMLSVVSHDLRNPVNAVKMLATAILRSDSGAVVPAEVVEHAGVMLQAANQMDALIQDLLDVTRLDSGRMTVSQRAVTLESVLDQVMDTLEPIAQSGGVALHRELHPELPEIEADPARLAQVLSNLVGNGIKYTPQGGRVTVIGALDRDVVRVSVTDTGVGIPENEVPRVFDRFWQSKRTNRSGAGLGLTIARGLIRAHGGRIWVESKVGDGTQVHFTIPRAGSTPAAPE